ncbi:MAG: PAS domain-containing hybrid sensor histidine kinase/response regulator [Bosea sp. (in: a-proteobacteria)]
MLPGWAVVLSALFYLCALFAVAHFADVSGRRLMNGPARATIYALALAVYCTSWTFYGSVGFAARSGFDFLAIYIGPILVIGFGHRFIARIVRIAKAQNITSIADFVGARYGKSERVAALVCFVAVIGALPYIALQLKAVSASLGALLAATGIGGDTSQWPFFGDLAFLVALVLAAFAMAFGTRHIDATEHQNGLVLAIAVESLIKLLAFVAVGAFITYWLFDGFGDIISRSLAPQDGRLPIWERTGSLGSFLTLTALSAFAAILLPRQFHMTIVENRDVGDVRRAAWMFPLYLVVINLFVLPVAMVGELLLTGPGIDRDMTLLLLPLQAGQPFLALFAFIGGLSAATAMVIVASVALAIMISNHLVLPLLVRGRGALASLRESRQAALPEIESPALTPPAPLPRADLGGQLIMIRRMAIIAVIMLGYVYFRMAGDAALATIGLLSFAAIAQVAPVFFGGLFWRRGTADGATAALIIGLATWCYTLFIPSLARSDGLFAEMVLKGPWGIGWLKPEALFGLDLAPLTHGVLWSLGLNLAAYIAMSFMRPANAMERLQAGNFIARDTTGMGQTLKLWRASVSASELQATVARYLGADRTQRAFEGFHAQHPGSHGREADIHMLRFAEHLIASAIGAASSRLVLSLLLKRRNLSSEAAFKLLDDASAALQHNRDLLQHALNHAGQGITVLDRELQLIAWNGAFIELYELPPTLVRTGVGIDEIIHFNAARGAYGPGNTEDLVATRLESFMHDRDPVRLTLFPSERVIEIRTNELPDGGLVTTYTDITEAVLAERALESANETLERRVQQRTEELTIVNGALTRAKAEAEEANTSKTRFLAAASHDILQPLNAARLYVSSLVERDKRDERPDLAENIDASLEAVEDILTALLDISRLDSGVLKPELTSFSIGEMMRQLQREFEPVAREKGLDLRFVIPSANIRSDRRLLRRLLQNLISNAIKYTPSGKVLVGARRRGGKLMLQVMDTGMGIPASKQKLVFREFQRLEEGARVARGLGLGLSIVQRIAQTLKISLALVSHPGRGSMFSIEMPLGADVVAMAVQAETQPTTLTPLAGLSVLAIDNEPTIIDGMKLLLGGWGCHVAVAHNRAEALASLAARRPDIILADYHLDEGDNGLDVIEALRHADALRQVRSGHRPLAAVLLTADRGPVVRDAASLADVHLLNKPLKPAALRALLAQLRVTRLAAE